MRSELFTGFLIIFSLMIILQSCQKEGENETKISSNGAKVSHQMGENCMDCHKQGGTGEGWFKIAGTIYDITKTSTYPNATVKLYTGVNGTGTLKYTIQVDALGNFYSTENVDFGTGLYPSVQGGTTKKYMSLVVTFGQCNNCHQVSLGRIWTN